jgi:NADH-quinone oxidoreductase subunit L
MVARMSPLYELSETALSFVMVIGATTAFFMGLIGLVQNDIKRVVAYSTLSQLGYMVTALGASAYAAGIFHLMTHAFFKALLFLAAGSVIIAMHHDQDIRNMGGIRKYMPYTWITFLIGTLALIGFPGFSGFFSKDAIIEAVHASQVGGAGYAWVLLTIGVFITALYSFRLYFIVFHGKERMDEQTRHHLHETPAVVWVPLVLLAIPSVFIGWMTIEPILFGAWFKGAIHVAPEHDVLGHMGEHYHGQWAFLLHGLMAAPFWLALAGFAVAAYVFWHLFSKDPQTEEKIRAKIPWFYDVLDRKYGFDDFYQKVFAGGSRGIGKAFWSGGDRAIIDGVVVNGSARTVGRFAEIARKIQTGRLYNYAIAMILGLVVLEAIFVAF